MLANTLVRDPEEKIQLSHAGLLIHGNCMIINVSCFKASKFMVFVTKQETSEELLFLRHSVLTVPPLALRV